MQAKSAVHMTAYPKAPADESSAEEVMRLTRDVRETLASIDEDQPTAESGPPVRPPETAQVAPTLWRTAAELFESEDVEVDWIVPGYLAKGAITELTAKIKTGKTHLVLDAVAAVLTGGTFLGQQVRQGPVLYLTEERTSTFLSALRCAGIDGARSLHVILRQDSRGLSFDAICREVLQRATQTGAVLVVIDTLPDWASLGGDSENDAGAALEVMRSVQLLAEAGLAVIILRHERKSGGEVGDGARGSSAFGGAADILISLKRAQGQGHANRRKLEAVGRFDEVPPQLIVEMVDGHYRALGTESDLEYQTVKNGLLEILPGSHDEALTLDTLCAQLDAKRTTVQDVLKKLQADGTVFREKGAGEASSRAFGFWQRDE